MVAKAKKTRRPLSDLVRNRKSRDTVKPSVTDQAPRAAYDAATDSKRRRPHTSTLLHEDEHLKPGDRRKVVGGTRDAARNMVLLSWMVRTYLNFVSGFTAKFSTDDDGLNRELRGLVREWSKKGNFDVRGIHSRRRFTRMAEARRILDGDVGILKLNSGHVQAIEGDRIRPPGHEALVNRKNENWYNGVRCNAAGRPMEYSIHKRRKGGFDFERIVRADRMIMHSWWEAHFRFDSCRGVSPIVAALNELADFYEGKEFARSKLKVAQALGLVIYSDSDEDTGNTTKSLAIDNDDDDETDGEDDGALYDVDVGGPPWMMRMQPGDKADFLSAGINADETVHFLTFCILVFLKALDLPMSYFREDFTNFFGSKIATVLMLKAARPKREDVKDNFLTPWFVWRLNAALGSGELVLPKSVSFEDVVRALAWIPDGMPWFDRSREVDPTMKAIAFGIESYTNVVAELHGMDLDEWTELKADEQKIIEESGALFGYDPLPDEVTNVVQDETDDDTKKEM